MNRGEVSHTNQSPFAVLSISILLAACSMFMSANAVYAEDVLPREEAEVELLSSVRIESYTEIQQENSVTRIDITPSLGGEFIVQKRTTVGLRPIERFNTPLPKDIIHISGKSRPGSAVVLTMTTNPATDMATTTDENGTWNFEMTADDLPSGVYRAYVQARYQGIESDEVPVAGFNVEERGLVSNSTWVVIILVGSALVLVMFAVNIQLYINRRRMRNYSPPIAAAEDPLV